MRTPTRNEPHGRRRPVEIAAIAFAAAALTTFTALAPPAGAAAPPTQGASAICPTTTDSGDFAPQAQLRKWNKAMDDFGVRTTGNRNHHRYVDWLQGRLGSVPGVDVRSLPYRFRRQTERSFSLQAGLGGQERRLAAASAVPYSKGTGKRGVSAPLVYLPGETEISAANAAGRIVVRDLPAGELQNSLFDFVDWFTYDPRGTFDPSGVYKRDWISGQADEDMAAASAAGAAGVLFVHELPREAIRGHYAPYHGVHWPIPALHMGVDEGARIKQAVEAGTAQDARIALSVRKEKRASTRMLIGRLSGPGERRVVVQTHSDGVNAVWDNGHVPILAIARYFASMARACRPGPMEFVFTTAHLYQRPTDAKGSTDKYAERLDRAYDAGKVALVLALEHLGAREWEAVPRGGSRPGLTIRRTGLNEPSTTFVTESEFLVDTLQEILRSRNIERSLLLQGTTLPDESHVPPWCSFGGEGTPYIQHLLPTVGFVTGPWTLFNPGYRMNELLDFKLLREQSLMFNDFLLRLRGASQEAIAGRYTQYRAERAAGKPTCFDVG